MKWRFVVVDIVGKALDEAGVVGLERVLYRDFARQIVQLARRGYATVRVRRMPRYALERILQRLERRGFDVGKVNVVATGRDGMYTMYAVIRDYWQLRAWYAGTHGLRPEILDAIAEALNKAGTIHIIF